MSLLGPALLSLGLMLAGCSDEQYGSLVCPSGAIDSLVIFPRLEFKQVTVMSAGDGIETGMAATESLYLGSDGQTRSEILVNFDFTNFDPDQPDSLFTVENIRNVYLSLTRLNPYTQGFEWSEGDTASNSEAIGIAYQVLQLESPFDPAAFTTPPGPVLPRGSSLLNLDFQEVNDADEPRIRLYPEDIVAWIESRATVGLVIAAGTGSDAGLVGFGSRELTHFNEVPPLNSGTIVAPNLIVQFQDRSIPSALIPPAQDTSTFEQIAALPPATAVIRTGIRSYPVFTFDMSSIPEGACVINMDFTLNFTAEPDVPWAEDPGYFSYVDTTRIDPSVWTAGAIDDESLRTTLTRLNPGSYDSNYGKLPVVMPVIFHPVDPTLGFWPSGSRFRSDIYFSQATFFGPGASAELRPRLTIKVITGE
jgi:hypothetical protein